MQDRYAGDAGDFGKYGLLRQLARVFDFRLGVVWCLVENENHTNDGRHVAYLDETHAHVYRPCDTELYDGLRRIVSSGRRSVSDIHQSGLLRAGTIFYEERLSFDAVDPRDRSTCREDWLRRALASTGSCDVVLLAPDNGLEVPSVGKYSRKGIKYAYYDELESFWGQEQSLVVYQHIDRSAPAGEQIRRRTLKIREHIGAEVEVQTLHYHRGTSRLFFLIAQPRHRADFRRGIRTLLASPWSDHFTRA